MKKTAIVILMIFAAAPCLATTRLMKLAEDRYLVTHQKQTYLGGQGKALRLSYEKAGSLCSVLGYSWFEIRETESKGRGWRSGAGATIEVKFFHEKVGENAEDFLNCEDLATKEQKAKMQKALKKMKQEAGARPGRVPGRSSTPGRRSLRPAVPAPR